MKEYMFSFEEKQPHTIGLPTFKMAARTKQRSRLTPLNVMFDDFRCLYLPKGHNCISTVWL